MHFRTEIRIPKPPFQIGYNDHLMSIGSCFSEHIGNYFQEARFSTCINPFGQQYNPASVSNAIARLLSGQPYTAGDLVYYEELYHSFDHHGSYSRPEEAATLTLINSELAQQAEALRRSTVLFLTFGTSHVFRRKDTGVIVSNCHKIPGSQFDFELMKPDVIVKMLHQQLKALRDINPNIKVVFTVSPVRYFAFGHYENSVSKAHLFTAIHELLALVDHSYYFPAYELVMDELRDYRFFAEDMLHPNYQATRFVWEKVVDTFFSKETRQVLMQVEQVVQAAKHRPRNPNSEAHRQFLERMARLRQQLTTRWGIPF